LKVGKPQAEKQLLCRQIRVHFELMARITQVILSKRGEVILPAGAVGSPHILQLSGVGDLERISPRSAYPSRMNCAASAGTRRTIMSRESPTGPSARRPPTSARGLPLAGEVMRMP
jgi:hypothetical protein